MLFSLLFFFNDTATTEIYTLSLHDALPISKRTGVMHSWQHGCELVGASRFERPTTRTPSEYATGLRHAPTCLVFLCRDAHCRLAAFWIATVRYRPSSGMRLKNFQNGL